MKYLLTTLNNTDSRAKATQDFIKMGFKINPQEIRFDSKDLPCVSERLDTIVSTDRDVFITETVNNLITVIGKNISSRINITGIDYQGSGVDVSLQVQDELTKITL